MKRWRKIMTALLAAVLALSFRTPVPANAEERTTAKVALAGTYFTDTAENLLDWFNEIRYEACKEGVPDPRDPSRRLSSKDYTPLKWSAFAESYARTRAAEASVYLSHNRVNGMSSQEALMDFMNKAGGSRVAENLAWYPDFSQGFESWYVEKEDWVKQTGAMTGHYTNIINPDLTHVAAAGFKRTGMSGVVTAADFLKLSADTDETKDDSSGEGEAILDADVTYLSMTMEGSETLNAGQSAQMSVSVTLTTPEGAYFSGSYPVTPADTQSWESSDTRVATVDQHGNVNAVSGGSAEIIFHNGASSVSKTVTVTGSSSAPSFRTHSLVLSGSIGVNFYMDIPTQYRAGSYMTFTISGKGTTTERDNFDANATNKAGTYYGFTCYVTPLQMADTITATFHYDGNKAISQTYSIKEYIQTFEANASSFDETTRQLIRNIADYGHYTQTGLAPSHSWVIGKDYAEMDLWFTEDYSDAQLSKITGACEGYKIFRDPSNSGFSQITFSLSLESETTLYVYFRPEQAFKEEVIFYTDGKISNDAQILSDGRYRLAVRNISAHKLAETCTIEAVTEKGFAIVKVSPLSYIYAGLCESDSKEVKDMLAALYYYYTANGAYRSASH